jgi:hypothetical protein
VDFLEGCYELAIAIVKLPTVVLKLYITIVKFPTVAVRTTLKLLSTSPNFLGLLRLVIKRSLSLLRVAVPTSEYP